MSNNELAAKVFLFVVWVIFLVCFVIALKHCVDNMLLAIKASMINDVLRERMHFKKYMRYFSVTWFMAFLLVSIVVYAVFFQ